MTESEKQLLDLYLDGELPDDQQAALLQCLESDPQAIAWLVERALLHEDVRAAMKDQALQQVAVAEMAAPPSTRIPGRWLSWRPLTAAVAVAACLVMGFLVILWAHRPGSAVHQQPGESQGLHYVAVLERVESAVWASGSPVRQTGHGLRAGEFNLASGRIEVRFLNGTRLAIEGPARFGIISEDRMSLTSGRLSADIPEEGIGFIVKTPTSEVRDLGTRFGVAVGDGGETETHVFEGMVDIYPKAGTKSRPHRLLASKGLAVNASGDQLTPLAANPVAFPLPERVENVPLPCAGFEMDAPGWNAGDAYPPSEFSVWGGDHIVRTAAERGIVPRSGNGMLRFMGAMRPGAKPENAGSASELYCWIDLRPYRAKWQGRRVTAEFSTWFNRVRSATSDLNVPTVIAATFGPGSTPGMETWNARLWRNRPGHALSNCDAEIRADADSGTWEEVTARVTIAPGAELLLLSVRVRSDMGNPADRRFDDVYADEPTLTFRVGDAIPNPR
ncbi:MAG: hypothetical protein B9S33_01945 [Pedosphaera sp. Tous-C6FEB]|nr:MAG: hypothetical protein B9S33_01945 [Pedosphaera sp. Tous-C6FEB]